MKLSNNLYLKKYSSNFKIKLEECYDIKKIVLLKNLFEDIKKKKKKIIILGNGGSAAIANHVCVDIVKLTKIKTLNFNNSSLFTCFANDYGHDRWMEQGLIHFGDEGDLLIAISSSGKSKNILNACRAAKRKRFRSIITLTGFNHDNKIKKIGNMNFWVNSKVYNFIENIHQIILLSTVDLYNKTYID
tara:strand:+ start:8266 stop:8829 length:564 start_codon:yes stop_codon:yes gene_type:complete